MTKAEFEAKEEKCDRCGLGGNLHWTWGGSEHENEEACVNHLTSERHDLVAEVERLQSLVGWYYRESLLRPHSTPEIVERLRETRKALGIDK